MSIKRFRRDARGGIVVIFGLTAPVLLALGGGVLEFSDLARIRTALQANVDAAALSGAREFAVQPLGAAERARQQADSAAETFRPRWTITTQGDADIARGTVTIRQDGSRASLFGSLLPAGSLGVKVVATAKNLTKTFSLCVLGSQQKGKDVVELKDSAILTATGCLVQSNGDIRASGSAQIRAGAVRAVGASQGSIMQAPVTDAPIVTDPFASLNIQVPKTCSDNDFVVSGTTTINPGVHCGHIKIKKSDRLILNPGEHYFLDANVDVEGTGQITGTDVTIIVGGKFDFSFKAQASFSIEGRRSGPYAGFAIVTDRVFAGKVELSTDSARQILGTVYLPAAKLLVSGSGNKVADQSAWTVVVARTIQVEGTAELVINSDYAGSSVPLPGAIATNGSVYLSQ